jgi:hypothetical protein
MTKIKKGESYEINNHQLYFSRLSVLIKLFRENKVSSKKRWMTFKIFFFAILTQPFIFFQRILFANRLNKINVNDKAPVFILGHWRSGTTHLHYLMSKDPNFGYVTNYHGFMISINLLGKGWLDRFLARFVPDKRPMDNVSFGMFSPSEEEQSLGNLSVCSGVHSFFFPKNKTYLNRFTTFKNANEVDMTSWKKAYDYVLKIVSYSAKGKRLLIKNPSNTSRAKELLSLYPDAKFIFIHRNPYEIYQSTLVLHQKMTKYQYLQDFSEEELNDLIFYHYNEVMRAYLDKRNSIPKGNLIEISYESLSKNPLKTIEKIYNELALDGFDAALPEMKAYLETVHNYEKNYLKTLSPEIINRIQKEWAFTFKEWGYEMDYSKKILQKQ